MSEAIKMTGLIERFKASWQNLTAVRKGNNSQRYTMAEGALAAFSVFFMQTPSFLASPCSTRPDAWRAKQTTTRQTSTARRKEIRGVTGQKSAEFIIVAQVSTSDAGDEGTRTSLKFSKRWRLYSTMCRTSGRSRSAQASAAARSSARWSRNSAIRRRPRR